MRATHQPKSRNTGHTNGTLAFQKELLRVEERLSHQQRTAFLAGRLVAPDKEDIWALDPARAPKVRRSGRMRTGIPTNVTSSDFPLPIPAATVPAPSSATPSAAASAAASARRTTSRSSRPPTSASSSSSSSAMAASGSQVLRSSLPLQLPGAPPSTGRSSASNRTVSTALINELRDKKLRLAAELRALDALEMEALAVSSASSFPSSMTPTDRSGWTSLTSRTSTYR